MLCVYGIVPASHPGVDATGVHGAPTRSVACGGLAAIVSEVEGELLARRRDVDAHLSVLEQALARGDVLPFRFGTVVDDEQAMFGVIEGSAVRYRELLDQLGGRVQMTVKALRDDDAAVATVVTSNDRLRRAAGRWRGSSDWSDRLALGEQVSTAVDDLSSRDAQLVLDRVAPLAEQIVVEDVRPPAIAFVALLMHPDRLAELDEAVAALHDELGSRITFDYAGPMPAYSFVR
ncbi:MAG TPA: GvpL/GvpF family gas vesicle protein [Mycobacteriales bacterium]|nr:GvpL/GvpF family gas vesicle protein [Mycobacteriales bacterium]